MPLAAASPAACPTTRRLAAVMVNAAAGDADGGCGRERLLEAGFSPAEIEALGERARALAARWRDHGRRVAVPPAPPRPPRAPDTRPRDPRRAAILDEIAAIEAAHDGLLPRAARARIEALAARLRQPRAEA